MNHIELFRHNGDFLTLTRKHEWHLEPFSFYISDHTEVRVLDTGIIVFEPHHCDSKTQDIVISSAIHGNETAPIEICDKLIQAIIKDCCRVKHRVMFIFGNPASINIGERFVEENMNRLFCGKHSEGEGLVNKERIRAKKIEGYVDDFYSEVKSTCQRIHYDLHTAIKESLKEKFAVYPYLGSDSGTDNRRWSKQQLNFLYSCGVKTVMLMNKAAPTFSYFTSSTYKAHSFTVELGKVRPFGKNEQARFLAAETSLTQLISESEFVAPDIALDKFDIYQVHRSIIKNTPDFELGFEDSTVNFTPFKIGDRLAKEEGSEILAEIDGEAIVFPNADVALGQRAILTVIPAKIDGQLE